MFRTLQIKIVERLLERLSKDSHIVTHGKRELRKQLNGSEGPDKWMAENVVQLLQLFSIQGHSGMSAPYCRGVFERLAKWEPLGPLTGEDDEWVEVDKDYYQNKRCPRVFKHGGKAYDIEGIVFEEPDGERFTSGDSHTDIEFPYYPKTEIVKVEAAQ